VSPMAFHQYVGTCAADDCSHGAQTVPRTYWFHRRSAQNASTGNTPSSPEEKWSFRGCPVALGTPRGQADDRGKGTSDYTATQPMVTWVV
jgi:hypothetical protein